MFRSTVPSWVSWLLVFVTAFGISLAARAERNPFGAIGIGANRSSYVGACPVNIVYTANINLNYPHPAGLEFNYYWVRSDGAKGPVTVVRPSPGQRMVIVREPWRLGAAGQHYDISETLFVNSGNTHLQQASQVVSVTCK
jgi:hypothetical protein